MSELMKIKFRLLGFALHEKQSCMYRSITMKVVIVCNHVFSNSLYEEFLVFFSKRKELNDCVGDRCLKFGRNLEYTPTNNVLSLSALFTP